MTSPIGNYFYSCGAILLYLIAMGCAVGDEVDDPVADSTVDASAERDAEVMLPADRAIVDAQLEEQSGDVYLPPEVNQEVVDEPVEITLRRCVEQMLAYLESARTAAGCDDYDMAVQSDRSSPYSMMPVAAACIRMECSGTQLEGHNGYMATRTCQDLDDLKATLLAAEEDATAGSCGTPTFQTRLLTLDEFVDQVPCDALTCGLAPDGEVIAIDQRY